jgi:hypothetical protein
MDLFFLATVAALWIRNMISKWFIGIGIGIGIGITTNIG